MPDREGRIVIPSGEFDDRADSTSHPDDEVESVGSRPEMKVLTTVDIAGMGTYNFGVPASFGENNFMLMVVDADGKIIPLITIHVGTSGSDTILQPQRNQQALDFFGQYVDISNLKQQFGQELESFLRSREN